jgi:hypothetical protein
MADNNCMVAIYNTHTEAEEAIKTLQKAGFDVLYKFLAPVNHECLPLD